MHVMRCNSRLLIGNNLGPHNVGCWVGRVGSVDFLLLTTVCHASLIELE